MILTIADIRRDSLLLGPAAVVCDPGLPKLCPKPYLAHPRGCPNFGKKAGCPPKAPYFLDIYETTVYVAAVRFDFAAYLEMMSSKHPGWTARQLRNPLYWQGHLRMHLNWLLEPRRANKGIRERGFEPLLVPEAMGVNVTETCARVGLEFEWPPERVVHVVALFAKPKELKLSPCSRPD